MGALALDGTAASTGRRSGCRRESGPRARDSGDSGGNLDPLRRPVARATRSVAPATAPENPFAIAASQQSAGPAPLPLTQLLLRPAPSPQPRLNGPDRRPDPSPPLRRSARSSGAGASGGPAGAEGRGPPGGRAGRRRRARRDRVRREGCARSSSRRSSAPCRTRCDHASPTMLLSVSAGESVTGRARMMAPLPVAVRRQIRKTHHFVHSLVTLSRALRDGPVPLP
jgi:hypothetical protein